jgi:hypothetical protein
VGLFGRSRKDLEEARRALAEARAEQARLGDELERANARQAALVAERDELVQARDTAAAERDTAMTAAEAARTETAQLRRRLDAAGSSVPDGSREGANLSDGLGGSWSLVLADLERRWAAGVGALPAARGVVDGPVAAQLAEGLTREVERLREEMGVDVSLSTGAPIEPADPVVFVLAATDMLGALAATCERVTVALDGEVVLTGKVWTELGDDLDRSRDRALAAGARVDPIDVDEDRVRVILWP